MEWKSDELRNDLMKFVYSFMNHLSTIIIEENIKDLGPLSMEEKHCFRNQ